MLDVDGATLILSVVYSVVGLGYCSYGRKNSVYYLYAGIALLIFPYFVDNVWWLFGIGIVLMGLPYLLDR